MSRSLRTKSDGLQSVNGLNIPFLDEFNNSDHINLPFENNETSTAASASMSANRTEPVKVNPCVLF